MAQRNLHTELASSMKKDGKGWNPALFEDETGIRYLNCSHCAFICRDAVELDCDEHEDAYDDEGYLYCQQCLEWMLEDLQQKCPISLHSDPSVVPHRYTRRRILKSIVICPYSAEYKVRCKRATASANSNVVDTMGNEVAEDYKEDVDDLASCRWRGCLRDLLSNHLPEHARRHDPSFVYRAEIKILNERVLRLQHELNEQSMKHEQSEQELQRRIFVLEDELTSNKQTMERLQDQVKDKERALQREWQQKQRVSNELEASKQQNEALKSRIIEQAALIEKMLQQEKPNNDR